MPHGRLRVTLITAACVAALGGSFEGRSTALTVSGRSSDHASVATRGRFVAIAWGARIAEGVTDVYLATSRDGGRTFGSPVRVNDAASAASLSGEQPPRVALTPRTGRDPSIVVVWTSKAATHTRLLASQSDDGGKSFAAPRAVPDTDAAGNRGWHSVATDREGDVAAIWLDHRELAPSGGPAASTRAPGHDHTTHGRGEDGVARAQRSKLFFAGLDGASAARVLTGGVCYCCKTAIATGVDGSIYAAWRHVYPGNVRDIAFTMSRDGGQTFAPPIRVSDDNWVLEGCPENGPAMVVDAGGRIHVVWPTLVAGRSESEPTLGLFYASSLDGRQFTPRQRVPTEGLPRHPQIAHDTRAGIVVTWDEQAQGHRRVALGRGTFDGHGSPRFQRHVIADDRRAVYPVVATADDAVVIAWTSGPVDQSVVRVERVPY